MMNLNQATNEAHRNQICLFSSRVFDMQQQFSKFPWILVKNAMFLAVTAQGGKVEHELEVNECLG